MPSLHLSGLSPPDICEVHPQAIPLFNIQRIRQLLLSFLKMHFVI